MSKLNFHFTIEISYLNIKCGVPVDKNSSRPGITMGGHIADHRVEPLKKSDLQFRYTPSVTEGDDPSKRNAPDNALLNRAEWYEVLYFVNKFANENATPDADRSLVAKKAERLIHRYLPGDQRSHANVTAWLLNHWNDFGDAPIV